MILMITVALTAGASFAAGDGVPAVERLWAEPGDRIGGESFLTLGLGVDDDVYFTDVSKLAEDWGMPEENRFGFIFGFNKRRECGGWMSLRGSAGNAGGPGGISRYSLDGGKIGRFGYSLDYRRGTHNYDTSSELRYPMAAPLLLTDVPELLWKAGFFKSRIRFSERMHLRLGAEDITRATSFQSSRPVSTIAWCTTRSADSRPTMPLAAACHSHDFASSGCGAWSVATMSIVPSARPSRTACTSSSRRSGGLTLKRAS